MSQRDGRLRLIRTALLAVEGFLAFAAISTGIELIAGTVHIPLVWIDTLPYPFSDGAVLGLLLAVIVGGSCLGSFLYLLRSPGYGAAYLSTYGALIVAAWMVVEGDALGPDTWLEPVFGLLTALLVCLAFTYLWRIDTDGECDTVRSEHLVGTCAASRSVEPRDLLVPSGSRAGDPATGEAREMFPRP